MSNEAGPKPDVDCAQPSDQLPAGAGVGELMITRATIERAHEAAARATVNTHFGVRSSSLPIFINSDGALR